MFDDFRKGKLQKIYNYMFNYPDINLVGSARRDILKREFYYHKGVQMVDLFHTSRGCRYSCYPCCVSYLGGRQFRPRPIDKVVEELETIENNRLTSDYIKERIKMYHDHGIMVEGTILLGMDNQTEDDILRLIDFLMEGCKCFDIQ